MNTHPFALSAITALLLVACSGPAPKPDAPRLVSADYTAVGPLHTVRAYVYGDRTVVEFDTEPGYVAIKDPTGIEVPFERMGKHFRLDRHLEQFTDYVDNVSVVFSAPVMTKVFSASTLVSADTATESVPDKVGPIAQPIETHPVEPELIALLDLCDQQLQDVRAFIDSPGATTTKANLDAAHARLDDIQARLSTAAAALIAVQFKVGSTVFAPTTHTAAVLIAAAKTAEHITISGHTDATIAGPLDGRIALGRAQAARTFLTRNGVSADKIAIEAIPAGDFIAPNVTSKGRAVNRRVDIELLDSRIAVARGVVIGAGISRSPRTSS